jgi:hypothetical protein
MTQELKNILSACYDYCMKGDLSHETRVICYSWIIKQYEAKFGTGFHQSRLKDLVALGFLRQEDTSRRGNRRYYALVNPTQIATLLQQ